jgi:RPA family protein
VGYPGGKTRQVSLRPEQVPQVRKAIQDYRDFKQALESISELNQFLLRLDREESKNEERES